MKLKKTNILSYLGILVFCIVVLFILNIFVLSAVLYSQQETNMLDPNRLMENVQLSNGSYQLSQNAKKEIREKKAFLMLLNDKGEIILSENLPQALHKKYSLKDVAIFTRYYLEDYPVQTYVEDEGLLVLGQEKASIWKYNLIYRTETIYRLMQLLPAILFLNIVLLIVLPLQIQKRFLIKKEIERTEWIAGVSHDIRTPLTLIMGHADQIRREPYSEQNGLKAEMIEKQGDRIKNLVTNLNLSSKLDFGIDKFESTDFKIGSKLRRILVDIVNRELDQHYSFDLVIDDEVKDVTIMANEALFQRLIENLINNAIRHNPEGCDIQIHLKEASHFKRKCEIAITDNGVGVHETMLAQLNSKQKKDVLNDREHGIGIQIVKQISAYYKWKIRFDNCNPKGLKVTIEL